MRDAIDSFDFSYNGRDFRAAIYRDDSMGAPWKEHGGHGEVTDWTSRDKRPGEMILSESRGKRRFYDFAGAVKLARREWIGAGPNKGKRAAAAALDDFNRLQGWCNDDWHWAGVVVTLLDDEGEPLEDATASLWGIESDAGAYFRDVAADCAGEILAEAFAPRMGLALALDGAAMADPVL